MSTAVEHVASRPGWACGACGADWPCAPAKVRLSEEYGDDEGALLVYLGQCMWDAFDDGVGAPYQRSCPIPPFLRERFVDWLVTPLLTRKSNVGPAVRASRNRPNG